MPTAADTFESPFRHQLLPHRLKRRIRLIFWLMTLCIVGINGFQGYWLYTTWGLTRQQFARDAREALFVVGQREQQAFSRFMMQEMERHAEIPARKIRATVVEVMQYSNTKTLRTDTSAPAPNVTIRRFKTDTSQLIGLDHVGAIARRWPIRLAALRRSYQHELHLRGNDAEFRLDTMQLNDMASLRLSDSLQVQFSFDSNTTGRRVQVFALPAPDSAGRSLTDSLNRLFAKPRRARPKVQIRLTGTAFQTPPVPLLLMRDLYVRATFPSPTFYVLRRMGGLLAGSIALLGLTTGCFLLMLNTILRQKKLSEVKNDFINNMTHELKTPIATVSAAVEALQNFGALQDPQKTETYLAISRQELQRLSDLVEKVLQMATEERRELVLNPEPLRPAAIIEALVARHQLKATKPVSFAVTVPPADTIQADALHFTNVVNNLIDNAIKYSGEQVTITIRAERDAAHWRLTVADDGPGIPRHYQEAIFDRFFRIPTGNLHPVKGFGLGLYYARQVLQRHGGHLRVWSEPGRGSAFTLSLPG